LMLFALHATLLLSAVWAIERLGGLKPPGWAELAWRIALFGAFVSVGFDIASVRERATDSPASAQAALETMTPDIATPDATVPASRPASSERFAAATYTNTPSIASVARPREGDGVSPKTHAATPVSSPAPTTLARAWEFDARTVAIALTAWLVGAFIFAFFTLRQALALRRLKRRIVCRGETPSDAVRTAVTRLSAQMGVRTPAVHVMPDLPGPLVFSSAMGQGTILLPRWVDGLDDTQRVALLAHEIAHLRRRDPLWRPLQRIALIPLFFHPLAWRAVHRLEALAETLCDRAAVERSGSARALAECLAECLARQSESYRSERHQPMWAVAMAERSDGIVARVRHLLEASPMSLSSIPKPVRWGAAVFALLALLALPGVWIVVRDRDQSLQVTYRNGGSSYRMTSDLPVPGDRYRIDVRGDVEFDAREADVVKLGPGAYVDIEEKRGTMLRSIRIVGDNGRIVRHYRVGETARPLDAEGRAWLAGAIPDLYRFTGFDAQRRAKRLLAEGGVDRLLVEIDTIQGDSVRAEYLGQLFAQATLDEAQLERTVAAIEAIQSDFEKRRTLGIALERDVFTPMYQARLLTIAAGFESDFERAEWLSQATPRFEIGEQERLQWAKTLAAFESDFERRRTLERMIEAGRPQPLATAIALQSARAMSSDFERRSLLEKAADSGIAISDTDYLQVVDAMESDFEQREALLALIRSGMPSRERSEAILRSLRSVDSEFERSEVLDALAAKMPKDDALIRAYRDLTRDMSNEARGAAERALDRFQNG
ncbi:MAG: M56 family metallopeptidase, partial [Lysobacter sp.]|nr:M56 family metallopeptidase [Lysobacter sp.]